MAQQPPDAKFVLGDLVDGMDTDGHVILRARVVKAIGYGPIGQKGGDWTYEVEQRITFGGTRKVYAKEKELRPVKKTEATAFIGISDRVRLQRIARLIEAADQSAMATDGPVRNTREVLTDADITYIYEASTMNLLDPGETPIFAEGLPQFDQWTDSQVAAHLRWLITQFNVTSRTLAERKVQVIGHSDVTDTAVGQPDAFEIAVDSINKRL